jgi:hypothetical protein
MTDPLLTRLTTLAPEEIRARLTPISWPSGLAPKVVVMNRDPNGPLPKVDVIISTYTAAEGQALADVLSPGLGLERWTPYRHFFSEYEADLTWRSPARESKCLGQYAVVTIGTKTVLLFRNELHLATDSPALPLRRCWAQMIHEATPSHWIDTGTAGGIGSSIVEGDGVVAQSIRFDCTGRFKNEPWAQEAYACTLPTSSIDFSLAEKLMAENAELLRPEATRNPSVVLGDVLTCDAFLFDDVEDTYALRTYDTAALAEEMDAAVLGLVAQDLAIGAPTACGCPMPLFTSVRSASDPQMPNLGSVKKEKALAASVYLKYGYAAQVATLCAVWQLVTAL